MFIRHRFLEEAQADGAAGGGEGQQQQGTEEGGEADAAQQQAAAEKEARKIGWRPKEQFRGDPEQWVDAQEFLDRGKTFIPFLNADRQRLQQELAARDREIAALRSETQSTRTSLQELTELHQEMATERKTRRKAEIGSELKEAREAGDDVRVAELQNELATLVKPEDKTERKPVERQTPTEPQLQPWLKSFLDENKEFFTIRNSALFNAIVAERRQAGDMRGFNGQAGGTEFMEEVKEEVTKALGSNPRRQMPSRTESGRPTGNSGRASGKGYGDMPTDARSKCDSQESRFVGAGKLFKTQDAWRKHFAGEYFGRS